MIWFLRILNKVVFHDRTTPIGGRWHGVQCYLYSKLKKCPHCKKPYWRKDRKGEDYKVGWVACGKSCGNIYCVSCMVFSRGFGTCPACVEQTIKTYDKMKEERDDGFKI